MKPATCQEQKRPCVSATRLSHVWSPNFRATSTVLRFVSLTLAILFENATTQTGNVSGIVRASDSRSPLANCNVIIGETSIGTITDETGSFSMDMPFGNYVFEFSHVGYETATRDLLLSALESTIHLTIDLEREIIEQDEVRVESEREAVAVSIQELERQRIRGMPTVYSDVLRSLKIVPGVTSNNELASSYNVRGGNHNENTIYLNGYEIYRPFLLRQGVEENQTLVNPDLVQNLRLHRGVFPARYAHKMSSILEVNYIDTPTAKLAGTVRADLFNMGVSLQKDWGGFNMIGGLRCAYPGLFVNKMQTRGNYRPLFADVQLLMQSDASPSSKLQLFVLSAYNKFDLTPLSWKGYFRGTSPTDIQEVEIDFTGNRSYAYSTSLAGVRLDKKHSDSTNFRLSLACSDIREDENNNTTGDIYYNGSPDDHDNERQYLKTRYDRANNSLDLFTLECHSILCYSSKRYRSEVGLNIKHVNLKNRLDEYYVEVSDSSMHEQPRILDERQRLGINSYNGYAQNTIALHTDLWANLGFRLLYYDYNDELLPSASAVLKYCPAVSEELHLGWGCYYQPPLFYELRNKDIGSSEPLRSQRAIHYVIGWEHTPKPELSVEVEAYYKDLDRLIPYHIEELRLEYADNNDHEGYAYGLDVLVKGEAADGLNSWIGYSYLNSREREKAGGEYVRSLLDQTHTLQVFLQDKVPKRENVQAHLRFLLGSGFLYHPRVANVNPETGETELMVDMKNVKSFPRYFRADVGMSGRFKVSENRYVTAVAELLNYFDNRNVSTYSFYQVFPGSKTPVKLPHILTRRTFKIGIRLDF